MVFHTKTAQVLAMVTRLTGWSLGLDERMTKIETRLGAIEMALTEQGVDLAAIGGTVAAVVVNGKIQPRKKRARKR